MPLGTCQGSDAACFAYAGMPPCAGGATCVRDSDAVCQDRYSCQKASYTTPAESADLPAGRASLEAALGARSPEGDTPTAAALTGVLEEALASRAAVPDHAHAVVFITDGLPVRCAPLDTPSIASIAGAALSSDVRTYAVGVFSAADRPGGQALLDALASAGGTSKPFVIDGTKDVSAPLGDALQAIRGSAIPCDYAIPAAPTGVLDPAKVNVEVDLDGRTVLIPRAKGGCGTEAGWTYDTDPASGAPSRVRMCPSTCAALVNDSSSVVRVTLGCDTIVR